MRYVILRDDDTNASTPIECLERLYRPFLERGLPVNLATIPNVRTDARMRSGALEGFLMANRAEGARTLPIGGATALVRYLRDNPGYRIVQHGYDHSLDEFDSTDANDIRERLERGRDLLVEAGFPAPQSFVAPYDKLSSVSLRETARRFRVISTGWFELRRLPLRWWLRYALRKCMKVSHWRVGNTALLTHPGCLLSCHHPYETMLAEIQRTVQQNHLTVLVTHWWEYFRNGRPDEAFIRVLHHTAAWLAGDPEVRVVAFEDAVPGAPARVPLR